MVLSGFGEGFGVSQLWDGCGVHQLWEELGYFGGMRWFCHIWGL